MHSSSSHVLDSYQILYKGQFMYMNNLKKSVAQMNKVNPNLPKS